MNIYECRVKCTYTDYEDFGDDGMSIMMPVYEEEYLEYGICVAETRGKAKAMFLNYVNDKWAEFTDVRTELIGKDVNYPAGTIDPHLFDVAVCEYCYGAVKGEYGVDCPHCDGKGIFSPQEWYERLGE